MKINQFVFGLFLAAAAQGATLYDTLGPNDQYQLSGSTIGGPRGAMIANWIEPTSSGEVDSITLAMGHTSGENLYRLDFARAGESGAPFSAFYSTEFSITGQLFTIALPGAPSLEEGVGFWLVISGEGEGTQGAWWTNGTGVQGLVAWRENSPAAPTLAAAGGWNVLGDQYLNALRIDTAVPGGTETPEPSSLLLAAPAFLVFSWMRRRRAIER